MNALDISLLMIGPSLLVVGVIIAVLGYVLERRKLEIKARIAADHARVINTDTDIEVARLKDRVAVLEKLVTSEDRRVAAEIAQLRGGTGKPSPDKQS